MFVVWGEFYLADWAALGPYTHEVLATARQSLSLDPSTGRPLFGDLRELEVREEMGLLHVQLAYAVRDPFVILVGVRDLWGAG